MKKRAIKSEARTMIACTIKLIDKNENKMTRKMKK